MMRNGIYPHPKGYPLVAGLELAGTVSQIGPDVTGLAIGDCVDAFSEDAGAYAEYCAVPTERIFKLPQAVGFDVGAAFYVQALTTWNLLHTVSKTQPGACTSPIANTWASAACAGRVFQGLISVITLSILI